MKLIKRKISKINISKAVFYGTLFPSDAIKSNLKLAIFVYNV